MSTRPCARYFTVLLTCLLWSGSTGWTGQGDEPPRPFGPHEVEVEFNVMVPMRDGIRLSTDIYRPVVGNIPGEAAPDEGRFPVLLTRSPYGNGSSPQTVEKYRRMASHGYVVVFQDVRGRYDSEGDWYPYIHEINDGYDTQQWAGTQAWSNGKVGTFGGSYLASDQWAAARLRSPYLKAMAPTMSPFNYYHDTAYVGNALSLASRIGWAVDIGARTGQLLPPDWEEKLMHLPLITLDRHLGWNLSHWQDWIQRPSYDRYWRVIDNEAQIPEINAGAISVGGWYDLFLKGTLASYTGMVENGNTEEARQGQMLIVGPWPHDVNRQKTGEIDYGPDAVIDVDGLERRWFDYWLKGEANGILDEPRVRIFVMGENRWRNENEWPLARTEYTKHYFHSQGHANSLNGDGALSVEEPDQQPADSYVYDPSDPIPTVGGSNMTVTPGAFDQRKVGRRDDVLVFTSAPLEADLEVTGPITVTLYAASSATDTDFTAKLIDVYPDGRAYNLQDGIIRARYRASSTEPTLIEPGTIYEYTIDLWATSNVFKEGHRLRVDISSSNFPRFDRNPNTGNAFGMDDEMQTATQTIYHNSQYPSHITLPIIPR